MAQHSLQARLRSMWIGARVVLRKSQLVLHETPPMRAASGDKHCIILHGWASAAPNMTNLQSALRKLPEAGDRRFWNVTYDTMWTSFGDSAQQIVDALSRQTHDFSDTVLIGYSMGGLVARQMVALGFPCRALITLCAPHHGPAPWIPLPPRGPRSMAGWNSELTRLNQNPIDAAHRNRYHFFAITYSDIFGHHEHDGIVMTRSALGEGLGEIAHREKIHLKYRMPPTYDPHWRGMFASRIAPVFPVAARLFAGGEDHTTAA